MKSFASNLCFVFLTHNIPTIPTKLEDLVYKSRAQKFSHFQRKLIFKDYPVSPP